MATPGYEPFRVLYHLFHQSVADEPLTSQQLSEIKTLVSAISRSSPEGTSILGRFMGRMEPRRLTIGQADLADGLLECLNPYQSYEPFTPEDNIRRGVYDHFKGGVYKAKGFSMWASGNGEQVVEYTSLLYGTDHTRLGSEWCNVVQWPDNKYRSRFVYRGPDLKTPAPAYKVLSPTV